MIHETGLLTQGRRPERPSLPTVIPGHIKIDAIQAVGPLCDYLHTFFLLPGIPSVLLPPSSIHLGTW